MCGEDWGRRVAGGGRQGKDSVHGVKWRAADTLPEVLGESATESHWTMSPRRLAIRGRD